LKEAGTKACYLKEDPSTFDSWWRIECVRIFLLRV